LKGQQKKILPNRVAAFSDLLTIKHLFLPFYMLIIHKLIAIFLFKNHFIAIFHRASPFLQQGF